MSADNQQERLSYNVKYTVYFGDLCSDHREHPFYASNDNEAIEKARSHVEGEGNGDAPSQIDQVVRVSEGEIVKILNLPLEIL